LPEEYKYQSLADIIRSTNLRQNVHERTQRRVTS